MKPQDIKKKFVTLVELNQSGTIIGDDAKKTAVALYESAKEIAEKVSAEFDKGKASFEERSEAHQVRFEMHQDLKGLGINVQY